MTVSKDTFYFVALKAITDVTTYGDVETNVVDASSKTFTSFKDLDETIVPDDVVNDAIPLYQCL